MITAGVPAARNAGRATAKKVGQAYVRVAKRRHTAAA